MKQRQNGVNTKISMSHLEDLATLDQQQELESIIKDLEEENGYLVEEYNRLQAQLSTKPPAQSSTHTSSKNLNMSTNDIIRNLSTRSSTLNYGHKNRYETTYASDTRSLTKSSRALSSSPTPPQFIGASNGSTNFLSHNLPCNNKLPNLFTPLVLPNGKTSSSSIKISNSNRDSQILAEARLLRQHEDRLEARMKILENHNRLLDSQLKQLKGLLNVRICLW